MIKFLDLKSIHDAYRAELEQEFASLLDSGWYIMGDKLAAFEASFADYCGQAHAIGVGNGLEALTLSLRALGIGEGDEVLVPSFTFIATWLGVSMAGATPVAVPVKAETANIDVDQLPENPGPRVKAIMPVHLYGSPADMVRLRAYADRHGLQLIADAAQAHGALVAGEPVCRFADISTFSFYPGKNLGAFGDGGAIVLDDGDRAAHIAKLRNYGSERKYEHDFQGTNSRLDELQAGLLNVRLKYLDAENAVRQRQAVLYREALSDMSDIFPLVSPAEDTLSAYHLFVIRTKERAALQDYLLSKGVQTQIHYPIAPCDQKAYADMQHDPAANAVARELASSVLSLPIGPHLTDDDIGGVCAALRSYAEAKS